MPKLATRQAGRNVDQSQLSLFPAAADRSAIENALKAVDVNNLTPMEALLKLDELKKISDAQNKK